MTLEYCCACGSPTGRAGAAEDSLYIDEEDGPYCPECYEAICSREDETWVTGNR